jgi:hypothetical protein
MDLELATTEDMIAELGRRGLVAALVVSHVLAKDSVPSPGLPMCGAKKVYFTDGTDAKCPTARGAAFLCVGIVSCFDEILGQGSGDMATEYATLSRIERTLHEFAAELEALEPAASS